MTPPAPHPESLKRRFQEAIELSPERRAAYIATLAREEPALHAPLLTLLKAHEDAALFLSEPTQLSTPTRVEGDAGGSRGGEDRAIEEAPGERVGPFELVEVLGEGGFAVVWRARQTHPVARDVALKILKPGMDSRQVLARFDAERQTLAKLAHPSIACVLDAGATPRGRPYFAMELVAGKPITAFCDAARLPVADRLRLFVSVCLAVEHAHQKGIIHRDLKPSNILVSVVDGRPLPVIIDFGIAKAVEERGASANGITEARQIVGTPQYMSPEQAGFGGAGVDTRTDVYSLGILLYELLAGVSPYDVAALRGAGVAEVARIVRDTRMSRPSTRFMSLGAARASVAGNRRSDERSLARQLRGDLDWIVLRATAKEPDARYPTASALALDVTSHLADRAVSAGPPSRVYRARKFVRRHRFAAASAGVALTAILAGLVLALVGLRQANEMRGVAEDALRVATGRLWDSYMAQARANREGSKPGRRAIALEAVRQAAAIRVTLGVRNEAIAALALDDVDFRSGPIIPGGSASAWGLRSAAYVVRQDVPGVARVVRAADATEVLRVGEPGAPFSHGAFSADATLFAAVVRTPGGTRTHVRQLPGGELAGAFPGGGGDAGGLRVGRREDGSVWLAVAGDDGTVSVRTPGRDEPLAVIRPDGTDGPARLDASPDARCIAVVRYSAKRVEAWTAGRRASRLWDVELPAAPASVAVAPDASMVAVGLEDRSVLVLDASSGATLRAIRGHQGLPVRLAFIDAGRVLASWAWDNTIRFWDVPTGLPIFGPIEGWTPANLGDEFTAVSDERLGTWRFARSRVYERLLADAPFGVNSACTFTPDGRFLIAGGRNGVRLLDAVSGRLLRTFHDAPANALALAGDGTIVLAPVEAGVMAWPLVDAGGQTTGGPREVLRTGPVGQVWVTPVPGPPHDRAVVVSPDGINVVLLDRGRVQRRLPPYPGLAERPDLTPDGRWLFTGNWRGPAGYVWNLATGERVLTIEAGHVVGRFSPRGDALVVGTPDRFVCYDVPSWRERWTAEREWSDSLAGVIAHAPDGSFVVVGHTRSQLRLLDPASGAELAMLRGPDMHELNDAAVSPDVRTIVCTTVDSVVQRWRLDVLRAELRALGEGMDIFSGVR